MSENFLIGEYLAKLQARVWLSHALCASGQHTAKRRRKFTRQSRFCLFLPHIHRFKKYFTLRLSNKPFLIWLLTPPPHIKYVVTVPCNLSLLTCFDDINVSQGSVATYARRGGIFNMHFIANLSRNVRVKKIVNRLRFERIMVMSLWPRFWITLYI